MSKSFRQVGCYVVSSAGKHVKQRNRNCETNNYILREEQAGGWGLEHHHLPSDLGRYSRMEPRSDICNAVLSCQAFPWYVP